MTDRTQSPSASFRFLSRAMPVEYHVFRNPTYVHLVFSGRVEVDDYFESLDELLSEEAFSPAIPALIEIAGGTEVTIDDGDISKGENISRIVRQVRGDASYRVAIAGGSADMRALVVVAQNSVNEQARVQAFDSTDAARQWLFS